MQTENSTDILLSDIINLSTSVEMLNESIRNHNTDISRVLNKINNVRAHIRQTVSSIKGVRKNSKQLGRQDLIVITNSLVNQINDYKVSIINLLYALETNLNRKQEIFNYLFDAKKLMKGLCTVLDKFAFPSKIKQKIVHYQNNEVKSQLKDVPNRGFFQEVFNEAHYHHSGHNRRNGLGPQFDRRGDWYHDGILTHYDGEKFEDIYLTPEGKKVSCGFLVQDLNTGKYLGCHPTGQPSNIYDIPKGCKKVGDDDLLTAIRELKEETGLDVPENYKSIEDLGIHSQKRDKDVHLYKVTIPVNLDELHCDSTFLDFRDYIKKPEMDDFALLENKDHFLFSIQPIVELGMTD